MKRLVVMVLVLLTACSRNPEYEYLKVAVVAKERVVYEDFTEYRMAFSNKMDRRVSYGVFTAYQIGDTMTFRKEVRGSYWWMVD